MDNKKIYYSFQDMPFSENYSSVNTSSHSRFSFSKQEIIQLFIAIVVLTLAFSFALAPSPPLSHLSEVINKIPLAFIAIITAFFCHELAHKYMGQRFGYWSEFRMYPMGLLLALFLGVTVGLVFAAPGAVQIFGQPTREESGKIAAVGPSTNLLIALLSVSLMLMTTGYLFQLFLILAYINTFLGFFNLLPFGPMDGVKIMSWRKEVWIVLLLLSIALFVLLLY